MSKLMSVLATTASVIALVGCGGGSSSGSHPVTSATTTTTAAKPAIPELAPMANPPAVADDTLGPFPAGVAVSVGNADNTAISGQFLNGSDKAVGSVVFDADKSGSGTLTIQSAGLNGGTAIVLPFTQVGGPDGKLGDLIGHDNFAAAFDLVDGLQFSTYGVWADSASHTAGAFASGQETPVSNVPKTGTATYNGGTVGQALIGGAPLLVEGDAKIGVDFGKASTTMALTNMKAFDATGAKPDAQAFPDVTGTGSLAGNKYSGNAAATGASMSGGFKGTLYGNAAQETAGTWSIKGTGGSAQGAFGAKQ